MNRSVYVVLGLRLPLLQPFHGGRWISYRLAGQDNIPHPGGCHGATERQDPGRSWGRKRVGLNIKQPFKQRALGQQDEKLHK